VRAQEGRTTLAFIEAMEYAALLRAGALDGAAIAVRACSSAPDCG